jgi:hypothetical protein
MGRGDQGQIDREGHDRDPAISTTWVRMFRKGRCSTMRQYSTRRSIQRNWIIVIAITMAMRMTDCAEDEPRLSWRKPSS